MVKKKGRKKSARVLNVRTTKKVIMDEFKSVACSSSDFISGKRNTLGEMADRGRRLDHT
jgi:hypothetical protein